MSVHHESFELRRDTWGQLVLRDAEGVVHEGVEPLRCFPVSQRDGWVSLCNQHGHELLLIESLDRLPPAVRELLDEELSRREFVPRIEQIEGVVGRFGPSEWSVQTDRGPTRFRLLSKDDVRHLGAASVMVIDSNGVRYLVRDIEQLDATSRRLLERFL